MDSSDVSQPFLHRLAAEIAENNQNCLVVLPNRRSLFVLKSLLPENYASALITIDDLMQQLSGYQLIEPEELLVSFYQSYIELEKNPQSFDQFSSWAITFLGDVNDIDLHLADVGALYKHIDEYHRTGAYFDEKAGPIEGAFVKFWERLPQYYARLQGVLTKLKLGYRGSIYRKVALQAQEKPDAVLAHFADKQVFWVGIVPGNPSERALIDLLLGAKVSLKLVADYDRFYIGERTSHEAGRLFRSHAHFGELPWETDIIARQPKTITVHPLPGKLTQVNRVRELLNKLDKREWHKAVVVLPEASLLLPLLKVFENDKEWLNVTGGFPMRHTMIHRFVMTWINLHAQAIEKNGTKLFYFKHIEEFLGFAVVRNWLKGVADWDALRKEIVNRNMRFVPITWLQKQMQDDLFAQEAFDLFFRWPNEVETVFQKMAVVLGDWEANTARLVVAPLERKAITTYMQKLKLMLSQFNELLPDHDLKALRRFVHRQIGFTKVYLEQPKNDALQVMGMLETRMIDFKYVFVLGSSEDSLPGAPRDVSHIPYIHRLSYGLPTRKDTESLMAYHFYRLITRAEEVHLLYDAVGDEWSSGEPSRYIIQLQEELVPANPSISWNSQGIEFKVSVRDQQKTIIHKSGAVLQDIAAYLRKGASPSGLNTFINSSLEFYYYYVLGLKEEDKVEEDIENSTFGSLVHSALEWVYQRFIGKQVNLTELESCIDQVDEEVEKLFLKEFEAADISRGRNLVKLEMAKEYVKSFIRFDLEEMRSNGPVAILALEERLAIDLEIDGLLVRLSGFADRIDKRGNNVRIIDYKTGSVKRSELVYDPLQLPHDRNYAKAMQLAIYKFIYCKRSGVLDDHVNSCIFAMRHFAQGYMALTVNEGTPKVMDSFEGVLTAVVRDMLDPTQPFAHNENSDYTTF